MERPEDRHLQAISMFLKLNRLHHSVFDKLVSSLGIHRSQHMLLMSLARREIDVSSQKELADEFGVSPAAITVSLKKLEKDGFIEKTVLEDDNRNNRITLTPKGREICMRTALAFSEADKYMFRNISDQEVEIFQSCISKMLSSLAELEAGGAALLVSDGEILDKTERKTTN